MRKDNKKFDDKEKMDYKIIKTTKRVKSNLLTEHAKKQGYDLERYLDEMNVVDDTYIMLYKDTRRHSQRLQSSGVIKNPNTIKNVFHRCKLGCLLYVGHQQTGTQLKYLPGK